jgi:hypothetical protein
MAGSPAVETGHVGLGRTLVDKHQSLRRHVTQFRVPSVASFLDVGTLLL